MTHFFPRPFVFGCLFLWHVTSVLAGEELKLLEVSQGIFVSQGVHEQMTASNQGRIGNSGFIVGEESVAVIDPGGSVREGERLKHAISKVTELPVQYLILTHFHPDHAAGAMAFAEASHVIAHENYVRAMTQRAQFYLDRFTDILPGSVGQNFRLPTQAIPIGQRLKVDLGERLLWIEAHALAHTDNDVSVHDDKTNTFWASDLVFAQRTPSLDGSLLGWLHVLAELDERDFKMTVPGHGEPGLWNVITASQKKYLIELRDNIRNLIREEVALSDVLSKHDQIQAQNLSWFLYAAQHGSNLAKAYTELEWE